MQEGPVIRQLHDKHMTTPVWLVSTTDAVASGLTLVRLSPHHSVSATPHQGKANDAADDCRTMTQVDNGVMFERQQ